MPEAKPFHNKANKKIGALLIHGLIGSPYQVKELGQFLHKKNISNFGVCLAGHGTKKEDLAKTTRKDWMDSARIAYDEFSKVYEKVVVLGFSVGGLIALNLAHENNPKGVIAVSTFYNMNLKGNLYSFLGIIKPNPSNKFTYDSIPPKSSYEAIMFAKDTKRITKKIKTPILILQGSEDPLVSLGSPFTIYNHIKSKKKYVIVYPGDDHILLKGNHKQEIFNKIHNFIKEVTK